MTLAQAESGDQVLLGWDHPSRAHLQLQDEAAPDPANVVTAGVFAGQGPVLTPDEAAEWHELRLNHLQLLTQARTVRGEFGEPGLLGQVLLQSPEIAPPAGLLAGPVPHPGCTAEGAPAVGRAGLGPPAAA